MYANWHSCVTPGISNADQSSLAVVCNAAVGSYDGYYADHLINISINWFHAPGDQLLEKYSFI